MKKGFKRFLCFFVAFALLITSGAFGYNKAQAKKAPKLGAKMVTVKVGKTKKVAVKNLAKKVKVSVKVKKKAIAKVTFKKNKLVVKGKKAGSTKAIVTVKAGKAKIKLYLTIKVKASSTSTTTTAPATTAAVATKPAATTTSNAPAAPVAPATTAAANVPSTEAPADDATEAPAEETEAPADETPFPTAVVYVTTEPITDVLSPYDDESNIAETATEKTLPDGSVIEIKDNGIMRSELTSQDLIKDYMGQGINLGNTLEASLSFGDRATATDPTQFETAWDAPVTTQEIIDGIHSYGFNTVRIPVSWSSMMDDETYEIDPKFVSRVETVVNYCLNNGMYVILNDHFDYGWWSEFGQEDEAWVEKAWSRYEKMWTLISEEFKDYSDHLIFEGANEELGTRLVNPIDENGYENATRSDLTATDKEFCYELTTKINQKFVDIVRASGGNNTTRHLLIAGFNTDIDSTSNDLYVMPEDIEDNGNTKLSISVHYYTPWAYCGDGQTGTKWGTEDQHQEMKDQFNKMTKFTDEGYGVMIGEYGVCVPQHENVIDFFSELIKCCDNLGYLPVLWDTVGMYYDRDKCRIRYSDVAELFNTVTGAEGDTSAPNTTGPVEYNLELIPSEDLKEDDLIFSWTGKWYKNGGDNLVGDDRSEKVESEDVSKFIITESCSDEEAFLPNSWGYRVHLKLDWNKYENPYVFCTFADGQDFFAVGDMELGTVNKLNGTPTDTVVVPYADHTVNAVNLPVANLLQNGYLVLTFKNKPTVTGIYVYDVK